MSAYVIYSLYSTYTNIILQENNFPHSKTNFQQPEQGLFRKYWAITLFFPMIVEIFFLDDGRILLIQDLYIE
jgi:hypothetical protein